jgi:hypothetical protein
VHGARCLGHQSPKRQSTPWTFGALMRRLTNCMVGVARLMS